MPMAVVNDASIWISLAPTAARKTPWSRCSSADHQRSSTLSASAPASSIASRASRGRSARSKASPFSDHAAFPPRRWLPPWSCEHRRSLPDANRIMPPWRDKRRWVPRLLRLETVPAPSARPERHEARNLARSRIRPNRSAGPPKHDRPLTFAQNHSVHGLACELVGRPASLR
jgi:hypothetical protein